VGKTTAAAATAPYWAGLDPARKMLVASADPAHSLSDSFDQPIGDEIRLIAGVPNLFALEMPDLMRQWFIAFFRLFLKYQGVVRLTKVAILPRDKSKQLRRVEKLLTDAGRCEFIAVTVPEAMAVSETRRLLRRLAELSVACRRLVVNMVVPSTECSFCAMMRDEQRRYPKELDTLAPMLIQVPLFPREIRGIERLSQVVRAIYGDGNG